MTNRLEHVECIIAQRSEPVVKVTGLNQQPMLSVDMIFKLDVITVRVSVTKRFCKLVQIVFCL